MEDLKKKLHEKLQKDNQGLTEGMRLTLSTGTEPVGINTGENGTFSIEKQANQPATEVLQKNLKDFYTSLERVKTNLKDMIPAAEQISTQQGNDAAAAMRYMLACIATFEQDGDPATLHVHLNNLMKSFGGSGIPYFK